MVDVDFDLSMNDVLTRQYYCALIRSLESLPGQLRLGTPIFSSGICQVLLSLSLPLNDWKNLQGYTASLLVLVGIPSLLVSTFSVQDSCEPFFAPDMREAFAVVRSVHFVMFVLLIGALLSQCYILVEYVKYRR